MRFVQEYYQSVLLLSATFAGSNSNNNTTSLMVFFMDGGLLIWNIINIIASSSVFISPNHPMKKLLTRTHYHFAHFIHNIPFFVECMLILLSIVTVYLGFNVCTASAAATTTTITEEKENEVECNNNYYYYGKEVVLLLLPRFIIAFYTLILSSVLRRLSDVLITLGIDRVYSIEQEIARETMLQFQPPSKEIGKAIVSPIESLIRTDVTGMDNIDTTEPALYVMNHSLHGLEMPSFVNMVYQEKNIFLRGLADHFHFSMPHGMLLKTFGAVDGTRDNVCALMERGENILVYPGGAHEVLKGSSVPKYSLLWKERLGFARLAIRYGYPIQPCAAVGTEDMLDIMMDIPVPFYRKGLSVPIPYPVSPHRLQKVYFWFGRPIPTKQYKGDWQNDVYAKEVRDKAKSAIETAIQQLIDKQRNDPDRYLMKTFAKQIRSAQKAACTVFEDFLLNNNKSSNTTGNENSKSEMEQEQDNDNDDDDNNNNNNNNNHNNHNNNKTKTQ